MFREAESYCALRVSAWTTNWGSAEGRGQCGVGLFLLSPWRACVCRQIMCGGGGGDLEGSVFCPGMHAALPWVNLPVCVCVRVCMSV